MRCILSDGKMKSSSRIVENHRILTLRGTVRVFVLSTVVEGCKRRVGQKTLEAMPTRQNRVALIIATEYDHTLLLIVVLTPPPSIRSTATEIKGKTLHLLSLTTCYITIVFALPPPFPLPHPRLPFFSISSWEGRVYVVDTCSFRYYFSVNSSFFILPPRTFYVVATDPWSDKPIGYRLRISTSWRPTRDRTDQSVTDCGFLRRGDTDPCSDRPIGYRCVYPQLLTRPINRVELASQSFNQPK